MLYEHRVYEPADGKAEALHRRFHEHGLPAFARHGIEVIGIFQPELSDGRLFYITCFADEAARAAAWAAFRTDPEWQRVKAETEADGPLMRGQTATVLHPTATGLLLG